MHYTDGKYPLEDGTFLKVANGHKYYFKDENYFILHRENDLPAIEYNAGTKEWCLNGKLHRENDLPAHEGFDGAKYWFINGERHRENGPAIEWANAMIPFNNK